MVKKIGFGDCLLISAVMVLGLAEVAHLGAVFLGWSISRCSVLFAVGLVVLLVMACAVLMWNRCGQRNVTQDAAIRGEQTWRQKREISGVAFLYLTFALLLMSQIVFVCIGDVTYRNGDMTVETVGSFLVHDGAYRVNPLTGNPYTVGIPLRLEILGLPTLYSMICSLTGAEPVVLVQVIVPVGVLLLSYLAFGILGKTLFGHSHRERAIFLILVALLMWAGTYMYGMDGFNLLLCGWRGVTIRNLVLIPWLVSLCIRRKYFGILLCLAAEICLVWTLYGLGVCLIVAAGMLLTGKWLDKREAAEASRAGKEEAV